MKCFIHYENEAVAACKLCGKGMCADCSAYSGHTGVCPECKKADYEREYWGLKSQERSLKWAIVGWSIVTIGLCWTIIGLIGGGIKLICRINDKKRNEERMTYLNGEITKLNTALGHGIARI